MDTDKGRGMILYIKDNIKYEPINLTEDFQEVVKYEINFGKDIRLIAALVYQSTTSTVENNERLFALLRDIAKAKYTHIMYNHDNG